MGRAGLVRKYLGSNGPVRAPRPKLVSVRFSPGRNWCQFGFPPGKTELTPISPVTPISPPYDPDCPDKRYVRIVPTGTERQKPLPERGPCQLAQYRIVTPRRELRRLCWEQGSDPSDTCQPAGWHYSPFFPQVRPRSAPSALGQCPLVELDVVGGHFQGRESQGLHVAEEVGEVAVVGLDGVVRVQGVAAPGDQGRGDGRGLAAGGLQGAGQEGGDLLRGRRGAVEEVAAFGHEGRAGRGRRQGRQGGANSFTGIFLIYGWCFRVHA